jgi:hypothetical protein
MTRALLATLLSASCLIGGCASTMETAPIVTARGVVPRAPLNPPHLGDLFTRFSSAAHDLSANSSDTPDTGRYLQAGFALIYADCDTFFRASGSSQRSANAVRDMIAPVVTLLTGIIALNHPNSAGDDRLLTALTLWSSASNAGFDIYERHYLFGAENIDSVRELILKALTVHSATVFNDQPTTLEDATVQLIDNQTICTPSHILRLVREAIRNGEIEPTITGSASVQQEFEVRRGLGQLLSPPNPLSDQQTFVLWQLLIDPRPDADRLPSFFTALESLGNNNPIQESGPAGAKSYAYRPGWPQESAVVQQLLHLPAETVSRYEASMRASPIVSAPAAGPETGGTHPAAEMRVPATSVQPALLPARRTTRRVGVSAR